MGESELAARLVLDHHIFETEAELRWLDDTEGVLARVPRTPAAAQINEPAVAAEPEEARP